jgi:hypothetical protein
MPLISNINAETRASVTSRARVVFDLYCICPYLLFLGDRDPFGWCEYFN